MTMYPRRNSVQMPGGAPHHLPLACKVRTVFLFIPKVTCRTRVLSTAPSPHQFLLCAWSPFHLFQFFCGAWFSSYLFPQEHTRIEPEPSKGPSETGSALKRKEMEFLWRDISKQISLSQPRKQPLQPMT